MTSIFEASSPDPRPRGLMLAFATMFIGFSIITWGGCSDLRYNLYTAEEPQTITAHQLSTEGPNNNFHVVVTEYTLNGRGVRSEGILWQIVRPNKRERGQATIVLKRELADNTQAKPAPIDGLHGLVYDSSGEINAGLKEAFPRTGQIDYDNLWIIEHEKNPPGWTSFFVKLIVGLLIAGAGAGGFFVVLKAFDDD